MTAHTIAEAKKNMRTALFDARKNLTPEQLLTANQAILEHSLELLKQLDASRVAAYVPVATEPGGADFADRLVAAGCTVLLPVCAPHRQLNWAEYSGPSGLAPARFGLLEPTTPLLPDGALDTCDLVFVPALASNRHGYRLGKGGGFYDIALSSLTTDVPTAVLVFETELRDDVPLEPHDSTCHFIITPTGILPTKGTV